MVIDNSVTIDGYVFYFRGDFKPGASVRAKAFPGQNLPRRAVKHPVAIKLVNMIEERPAKLNDGVRRVWEAKMLLKESWFAMATPKCIDPPRAQKLRAKNKWRKLLNKKKYPSTPIAHPGYCPIIHPGGPRWVGGAPIIHPPNNYGPIIHPPNYSSPIAQLLPRGGTRVGLSFVFHSDDHGIPCENSVSRRRGDFSPPGTTGVGGIGSRITLTGGPGTP